MALLKGALYPSLIMKAPVVDVLGLAFLSCGSPSGVAKRSGLSLGGPEIGLQ